jgi:hypothetical protein
MVLRSVVAEKSTILDNAARMDNRIEQRSVLAYKSRYVIAENHPLSETASYPRRMQSSMAIFTFSCRRFVGLP